MNDQDIIRGIGSKTGADMWQHIDDLIVRWTKRNPFGANLNLMYNEERRSELKDKKFAKSAAMADGRLMLSIHPELVNYIEAFYPRFFASKENVRRFAKTYKMFRMGESV